MNGLDRIAAYVRNRMEYVVLWGLVLLVGGYATTVFVPKMSQRSAQSEVDLVVRKINIKGQKLGPLRRKMKKMNYVGLMHLLKKFSYYEEFLTRDIFHPFEVDVKVDEIVVNPYVLLKVIRHEVPFVWMGTFSKKDDKKLYVQFNSKKGTSFLKKGDRIMRYEIVEATPYHVDVRREGRDSILRLEKDKVALEEGIHAKIYNKESGKTFVIREGDFTEGWDVRSIANDGVTLHKGGVSVLVKKGDEQE